MKKYIKYIICVAALLTACANKQLTENSYSSEEKNTSFTVATESITEKISQITTPQITTLEQWAHNFAKGVYAELENNKTADDPTPFAPISNNHEVTAFDIDAMCADIFFLDVNDDDIPELFVGGHGTMGNGRYSIYDVDGNCFGNDKFIWEIESFETDGQYLYAPSGSNSLLGHTKLTQGLPKIYANGFAFMNGTPTEATIETAGSKIVVTIDSQSDFENLYSQYLNTDYNDLKVIDMNKYICIRDYLRVPDPENYTEEDIYNCLLTLLQEYESEEQR